MIAFKFVELIAATGEDKKLKEWARITGNRSRLLYLKKHYTPKSKIEQRIKELESEIVKQKKDEGWKEGCYFDDFGKYGRIKELKELLK